MGEDYILLFISWASALIRNEWLCMLADQLLFFVDPPRVYVID